MSKRVKPQPGMIITEDTVFEPGEYVFPGGSGIIVAGNHITIDGNGASIIGTGVPHKKYSYSGNGLYANGYSHVTVKNLKIKGFLIGMKILNGEHWTIVDNDLSDNFTDPDYGWGDGDPYGALLLERVSRSGIRNNKGDGVWNGLSLHNSHDNEITDNNFSHCTNVCLKLWGSCRNEIRNNVMSHGIRIAPGEVHARDSTSALIESGSNDNRFYDNDFTYGGDGVFIRSLNGHVSRGNYFEGNDASFAHNNAWEVWDPDNTFINNKGNHSSYGFWLGGSCHAVLIGNEAAYNGLRIANAPEKFGNAGIAVVKGSSSHFTMKNNYVHHNKSVGVAIHYKEGYEAFHWIIQQNKIEHNETYGIYIKHAKWLDIAGNDFNENKLGNIHYDENVTDVFERTASDGDRPPAAHAELSVDRVFAGEEVTFDASQSSDPLGSPLLYRWDMGDGTVYQDSTVTHMYAQPGFYRVGVTVNNQKLSDLAWFDLYVLKKGQEIASTGNWGISFREPGTYAELTNDTIIAVHGHQSMKVESDTKLGIWHYPEQKNACWNLRDKHEISFWAKFAHETRDGYEAANLTMRLCQDDQNYFGYFPRVPLLNWTSLSSESRYGWTYVRIPLNRNPEWHNHVVGHPSPENISFLQIVSLSVGGPYRLWIDGLLIE